uniref:restriction endonuclease subunit S n=2 Tax=Streptococcus intermedius TaxID=1338 RepID=UPI002155AE0C|nr:restriction endonuclease subunit S [Streptococcus intermedius]
MDLEVDKLNMSKILEREIMVNNDIPKIRFKQFNNNWKSKNLGSLGSVAMNKRIFKEETSETGEIPFYKIGTFGGEPDSFITREKFENYKSKYPYPEIGDILISASGSIGRTVEYQGEDAYFQDSNIVWLKHDERLDNSFLKQFYSIVKWEGIEGTTIKRLYNKNILETPITLPSPEEQSAIGSLFRTLDDLLAAYKDNLANYQAFKASMLSKIFPKAGQTVPEIRLDGFEGEWKIKELGKVIKFYSGLTYKPSDVLSSGTLVLRSSNVRDGELIYKDNVFVNPDIVNCQNVKLGDIVVVVRNGSRDLIGKHALIKSEMPNTVIGAFMTGVRCDNPEFINALLDTKRFISEINRNLGSTINQITTGNFKRMKFYFPLKDEQRAIGSFFSNLDTFISSYQDKISQLEALKKKLLQDMFI